MENPKPQLNTVLSDASFWMPQLYAPSGWIEHAPFGFWLVQTHKPETLVELGTYHGYSYFVFNQAVKTLGLKTRLYAIDNWSGDEHAGFYGEDVYARVDAYNEQHYSDASELMRATFDEALERFQDGSIDLLHIDGRHRFADVQHDFETWRPKLSNRAIVLFHDTNVLVKDFGVHRLWSELAAQFGHFEFLHGHGLGVLAFGADGTHAIKPLLDAAEDELAANTVREVYSRLGRHLSEHFQLEQIQTEVAAWKKEVAAHKEQMAIAKRDIEWLNEQVRTKSAELRCSAQAERDIQWLKEQVQTKSDALKSTSEAAAWLQMQLEQAQKDLVEQQNALARIKDEDLQQRIAVTDQFGKQIDQLRGEIRDLESTKMEKDRLWKDALIDAEKAIVEAAGLRRRLRQLEQELRGAAHYAAEYKKAIASRSWKITRPLRAISGMTKGTGNAPDEQ